MLYANVVILAGEVHQAPRGFSVGQSRKASALIAQKRPFGNEGKTANDMFEVVGWGQMANKVELLPVGGRVMVQGRLRPESYEKDGKRIFKQVVVAETVTLEGDAAQVDQAPPPSDDPF